MVLVPFLIRAYQESRMDVIKGQADLLYRDGTFYLAVTLDVPTPTPTPADETLGVDLGIINLVTTLKVKRSAVMLLSRFVPVIMPCVKRLQKAWHEIGQTSSQRNFSGKGARFRKNTNHVISPPKWIVQKAKQQHKAIAIEELRHIRPPTDGTHG